MRRNAIHNCTAFAFAMLCGAAFAQETAEDVHGYVALGDAPFDTVVPTKRTIEELESSFETVVASRLATVEARVEAAVEDLGEAVNAKIDDADVDERVRQNSRIVPGEGQDSAQLRFDYGTTLHLVPATNAAISQASSALGQGTVAGQKAYRYAAIDFDARRITFQREPIGWAVGDTLSLINDSKYPNCCTIEEIDGKVVTVSAIPFSAIKLDLDFDGSVGYVESKPLVGTIDIGGGANATGIGTAALGFTAHAEGYAAIAAGQYSHAEGKNTYAQYAAHAEGWNNRAEGFGSHVEGQSNTAKGSYSHAAGRNATAAHDRAFAWNGSSSGPYESHGAGTFNVNPQGGADGFYVGGQTLRQIATNDTQRIVRRYVEGQIEEGGYSRLDVGATTNGYIYAKLDSYRAADDTDHALYIYANTNLNAAAPLTIPSAYGNIEIPNLTTVSRLIAEAAAQAEAVAQAEAAAAATTATNWSAAALAAHKHAAADVTSGTFATARIPNLAASKITSGTFAAARLPAATDTTLGAVRPDGQTLTVTGGVLYATAPAPEATLRTAAAWYDRGETDSVILGDVAALSAKVPPAGPAIMIGYDAQATAVDAIAIGSQPRATAEGGIAIGPDAKATHKNSVVIGAYSSTKSHGEGTFNVNPKAGAEGFYIGESNLVQIVEAVLRSHGLIGSGN